MSQLLVRGIKFMRSLLKIVLPLAVLGCFVMPIYGYLVRWSPADEALLRYTNDTAVMIAGSYQYESTSSNQGTRESVYRDRTYILLPSILSEPKTVTFSQKNNEPYQISEDQNGVLKTLIMYGLIAFGTWWFWFRKPGKP